MFLKGYLQGPHMHRIKQKCIQLKMVRVILNVHIWYRSQISLNQIYSSATWSWFTQRFLWLKSKKVTTELKKKPGWGWGGAGEDPSEWCLTFWRMNGKEVSFPFKWLICFHFILPLCGILWLNLAWLLITVNLHCANLIVKFRCVCQPPKLDFDYSLFMKKNY